MIRITPVISALLIMFGTAFSGLASADFKQVVENVKRQLERYQADIVVGQDFSMMYTNLILDDNGDKVKSNLGLGTTTLIGAHLGLKANSRVTVLAGFMYDGINPVEEEDLYGVNITRLSLTATYDQLFPYTFHPNFKAYGSAGISATYASYSNIHTLDWDGLLGSSYEDQTLFETGLVLAVPLDWQINQDIGVTLTPFTDFNFARGTTQIFGARFTVRIF